MPFDSTRMFWVPPPPFNPGMDRTQVGVTIAFALRTAHCAGNSQAKAREPLSN